MPAANLLFGKIAALAPQKRQCELGSYYPAGTLVKPLPRQAAGTLEAMRGQSSVLTVKKKNDTMSKKIVNLQKFSYAKRISRYETTMVK